MQMRILLWIFRWVCLVVLVCLAIAVLRIGLTPLREFHGWKALGASNALWVAGCAFLFRMLLTRIRGGDPLEFLDTLEHELTHAFTGYLTFAPPVSLTATLREGGEVELPRANPIAALSPYFLPLYATFAALLTLVMQSGSQHYGRIAVAFLLGSFAYRFLREFHMGQSDFKQYGFIYSLAFIAALLPICLAGILGAAHLWHIPWHTGVWPLFMEQGQWISHFLHGFLKKHG